jgi:hypothetical protein
MPPIQTIATTVQGLVLHEVVGEDRPAILDALRHIVGLSPRDHLKFPGPSPVSIERADLPTLRGKTYLTCEKTDGWRAFMILCNFNGVNVCCIFDRKLTPYICYLQQVPSALWQGSGFDGEVVWNKRHRTWTFLIFDALRVSGIPVYARAFGDRVYIAELAWEAYRVSENDVFRVRVKTFVDSNNIGNLPEHVDKMRQEYETDGIILTPDEPNVIFGRHRRLFKLKTKHTVDFWVSEDGKGLCVYDPSVHRHVKVGEVADGLQRAGAIVECIHKQHQTWTALQVRTDKNHANDMLTFNKTVLNMEEALTLQDILNIFLKL